MTDRVTRTYFARWPRWRSSYERPVNWLLFRVWDIVPLLAGMALAAFATVPDPVVTVLAGWYFVGFPIIFFRRRQARARYCATQGHHPWRPVPEADEWECLYCGTPLRMRDPQVVATAVANAASEADLRRRRQSYYSDRR